MTRILLCQIDILGFGVFEIRSKYSHFFQFRNLKGMFRNFFIGDELDLHTVLEIDLRQT